MANRRTTIRVSLSLAALVVAGYLLSTLHAGDGVPSRFPFVCVETGEIFTLSIGEAGTNPAKNPRTGRRTLVLCERRDDGTYVVAKDDGWLITDELKDLNHFVDPVTLEVKKP